MPGFLTLDRYGVILALALGAAILILGGSYGLYFLAVMLLFLGLSAIVTTIGGKKKRRLGVYEGSRGWKNVAANGAVPLLVIAVYRIAVFMGMQAHPELFVLAYVASVAAITSDKFASEIGVLDGAPTMLLTMRKVKRGKSGAVTGLGLLASFIGASLVSVFALFSFAIASHAYLVLMAITAFSGFAGNLVDSVFGYYEEQGFGNKYTSNMLCSLAGCIIEIALVIL